MNTTTLTGYTTRAVTMEDLTAAVDLINADARFLYGANDTSIEDLRMQWEAPIFHLADDTIAVFTPDGAMVGYAEFWDPKELHVVYDIFTIVHPEFRGLGIGSQIQRWACERAERSMLKALPDARVVIRQWLNEKEVQGRALLEHRGWTHVRNSYRMQIDFTGAVHEPSVPDGIVIRGIDGEEDLRDALFAAHESFLDHWGIVEEPFEDFYQRWKWITSNDPYFDPSLWFVAIEGETIAGVSFCNGHMEEDPQLGWVGTLGVRRPWRKRGVGQALLEHSFAEFARRGYQRVGLSVDASSLTGATRLYERAGMRVVRLYHMFEREVRPGKELSRQSLE